MVATQTMLGELSIEGAVYPENGGVGTPDVTLYRPTGTPVRNDGIWHHWMARGETYRLEHDGTGWRVTCHSWRDGHVRRLVEADDMRYVDELPLTDGRMTLDSTQVYKLAEALPYGPWAVYAL